MITASNTVTGHKLGFHDGDFFGDPIAAHLATRMLGGTEPIDSGDPHHGDVTPSATDPMGLLAVLRHAIAPEAPFAGFVEVIDFDGQLNRLSTPPSPAMAAKSLQVKAGMFGRSIRDITGTVVDQVAARNGVLRVGNGFRCPDNTANGGTFTDAMGSTCGPRIVVGEIQEALGSAVSTLLDTVDDNGYPVRGREGGKSAAIQAKNRQILDALNAARSQVFRPDPDWVDTENRNSPTQILDVEAMGERQRNTARGVLGDVRSYLDGGPSPSNASLVTATQIDQLHPEVQQLIRDLDDDELLELLEQQAVKFHQGLDREVLVDMPAGQRFDAFLAEGRYRSTHETVSDHSSSSTRINVERQFGFAHDTPVELRPISGFVNHPDFDQEAADMYRRVAGRTATEFAPLPDIAGPQKAYGSIRIRLRPEVSERSGYALGDSARNAFLPTPMAETDRARILTGVLAGANFNSEQLGNVTLGLLEARRTGSFRHLNANRAGDPSLDRAESPLGRVYFEALVPGAFTLDEVDEITIPYNDLSAHRSDPARAEQDAIEQMTQLRTEFYTPTALREMGLADDEIAYAIAGINETPLLRNGKPNVEASGPEDQLLAFRRASRYKSEIEALGLSVQVTHSANLDIFDPRSYGGQPGDDIETILKGRIAQQLPKDIRSRRTNDPNPNPTPVDIVDAAIAGSRDSLDDRNAAIVDGLEGVGGKPFAPDADYVDEVRGMTGPYALRTVQQASDRQQTRIRDAFGVTREYLRTGDLPEPDWMGRRPAGFNRASIDALHPDLKQMILDSSDDELMDVMRRRAAEFHEGLSRNVRVSISDGSRFGSFLSDGRYLTTHTASSDHSGPETRIQYETTIGIHPDTAPELRPASGYMVHPDWEAAAAADFERVNGRPATDFGLLDRTRIGGPVDTYGDVDLILRPEVADRVAYGRGDSISTELLPMPLSGADPDRALLAVVSADHRESHLFPDQMFGLLDSERIGSFRNLNSLNAANPNDRGAERQYFEALIPGSFTTDDVAAVRIGWSDLTTPMRPPGQLPGWDRDERSQAIRDELLTPEALALTGFDAEEVDFLQGILDSYQPSEATDLSIPPFVVSAQLKQLMAFRVARQRRDEITAKGIDVQVKHPKNVDPFRPATYGLGTDASLDDIDALLVGRFNAALPDLVRDYRNSNPGPQSAPVPAPTPNPEDGNQIDSRGAAILAKNQQILDAISEAGGHVFAPSVEMAEKYRGKTIGFGVLTPEERHARQVEVSTRTIDEMREYLTTGKRRQAFDRTQTDDWEIVDSLHPDVKQLIAETSNEELLEIMSDTSIRFHEGVSKNLRVSMPHGQRLEQFLADGRYKTTHEVESDHSDKGIRGDYELQIGFPEDLANELRPASAYVTHPDWDEASIEKFKAENDGKEPTEFSDLPRGAYGSVGSYGTVDLILRPEVAERAAYGNGDSITTMLLPARFDETDPKRVFSAVVSSGGRDRHSIGRQVLGLLEANRTGSFKYLNSLYGASNPDGEEHLHRQYFEALIPGTFGVEEVAAIRIDYSYLSARTVSLDDRMSGKDALEQTKQIRDEFFSTETLERMGFSEEEIQYIMGRLDNSRSSSTETINNPFMILQLDQLLEFREAKKRKAEIESKGIQVQVTHNKGTDPFNPVTYDGKEGDDVEQILYEQVLRVLPKVIREDRESKAEQARESAEREARGEEEPTYG